MPSSEEIATIKVEICKKVPYYLVWLLWEMHEKEIEIFEP